MNTKLLAAQAAYLVAKAAADAADRVWEQDPCDASAEAAWDKAVAAESAAGDALILVARDAVRHMPMFSETLPVWERALVGGEARIKVLDLVSRLSATTC